mgnify:CR=1 FL=1
MLSRRAAGFLAAFSVAIGTLGVTPLSAHLLTTAIPDGRIVTEEHVDLARIPARVAVPGLDGPLNNLLAASRNGDLPPTDTAARVAGVRVVQNTVQVMVEALDPAATEPVRAAIASEGGTLEVEYQGLLQATVPVAALERLPAAPGVRLVRSPFHPQPTAIQNEGMAAMGLGQWYDNGLRGAGAKLAVLDLGFDGYWNRAAHQRRHPLVPGRRRHHRLQRHPRHRGRRGSL